MPDNASQAQVDAIRFDLLDPEVAMRNLAQTIRTHAGPMSSGRMAVINIPMLGIEDIHFSQDGEAVVAFRTGGGDAEPRTLDAEECNALSGFFAALAQLLGFRA